MSQGSNASSLRLRVGSLAGDLTGDLAGDLTGDRRGDLTGDLATGDFAGDLGVNGLARGDLLPVLAGDFGDFNDPCGA